MNYLQLATSFLETRLKGKYITLDAITPILKSFENVFEVTSAGKSVEGRVIYKVKIGNGPTKILMWSQMHGNEPTTTKGLFDFFNFLLRVHIFPLRKKKTTGESFRQNLLQLFFLASLKLKFALKKALLFLRSTSLRKLKAMTIIQ